MTTKTSPRELTAALEDYLETIYLVTQDRPVARIKDIAKARGVRSASVTPAMRRLEEMGLIRYERRDYIELSEVGVEEARRVYARHRVLTSFFEKVLSMSPSKSREQACLMEHLVTDEAMDRFVRFFEFLKTCPQVPEDMLMKFKRCCRLGGVAEDCPTACDVPGCLETGLKEDTMSVSQMSVGQRASVMKVKASPAIRKRLLDMGVLPGASIVLERLAPSGDPLWVRVDDFHLSLRRREAQGVIIET